MKSVQDSHFVIEEVKADVVLGLKLAEEFSDACEAVGLRCRLGIKHIEKKNGDTGRGGISGRDVGINVGSGNGRRREKMAVIDRRKKADGLRLAIVEKSDVVLGEILNRMALVVGNNQADADDASGGADYGAMIVLRECGGGHEKRQEG